MLLSVDVEPGRIHFLRHTVIGTRREDAQLGALTPVDERLGRELER